jgi:hypothetical protein
MTYGVDHDWQQLKLHACGLTSNYLIIGTPKKVPFLQAMRTMRQVQKIILVDDKASAFTGLPETNEYAGFWLQRGKLLPSQRGTIPNNVTIIPSLHRLSP